MKAGVLLPNILGCVVVLFFATCAESRLLQKAGSFTNSHIKAFKGAYCVNLANGKVVEGTNVQVYECHAVDENYFSYSASGDIRPKLGQDVCFEVSPDEKHNIYLAKCTGATNQQWDFLSNGQIMSRKKFLDQPKGSCFQLQNAAKAANIAGSNCDATSLFQSFTVDKFEPSIPTTSAGVPRVIDTTNKKESTIEYNQRLQDRAGFHKVKTEAGCYCKVAWTEGADTFEYPNNCANPGKLHQYNWCFTIESEKCKGVDGHHHWDRCTPPPEASASVNEAEYTETKGGCKCQHSWQSNGRVFTYPNNCGDPDNIMGKDWCYVRKDSCATSRSDGKEIKWDYCTPSPKASPKAPLPSNVLPAVQAAGGAMTKTLNGCICDTWNTHEGYSETHNQCGYDKGNGKWCFVRDKACEGGKNYGFCEKPGATKTKTLKGCECDLWASHSSEYSSGIGNECGYDKGLGTWCFVKNKACQNGAAYGFCEKREGAAAPVKTDAVKVVSEPSTALRLQTAAPTGFKPANPHCGHGDVQTDNSCKCRPGFTGEKCSYCAPGYAGYPDCQPKEKNAPHSIETTSPHTMGAVAGRMVPASLPVSPRHFHLLSIFSIIAFFMCCGCVCRGGACLRCLQLMRKPDNKLPDL